MWAAVTSPDGSSVNLALAVVFSLVTVPALYMCFASLRQWWPVHRLRTRPAQAKPSAVHDGIKLDSVDDRWELWRSCAWIAEVRVMVTNITASQVIRLTRFDLESDPGPLWAERPELEPQELISLRDELATRWPLNPQMDLRPGESRLITVVSDAFLPYPAGEGRPYCEFVVADAEGKPYPLPVSLGGSQTAGQYLPERMRLRNLAMQGRLLRTLIRDRNADARAFLADASERRRHEYWMTRVARALRPWPESQAQFQAGRTAVTDGDATFIIQRTEQLEEILRALDGRRRQDGPHRLVPSPSDPPDAPQQSSPLAHIRRGQAVGAVILGDLVAKEKTSEHGAVGAMR